MLLMLFCVRSQDRRELRFVEGFIRSGNSNTLTIGKTRETSLVPSIGNDC
jgi:hypothetical protein